MINCAELVGEYVKSITYEIIYITSDMDIDKYRYTTLHFDNVYGPITYRKVGKHDTYWVDVQDVEVCIFHSGTKCDRQYAFNHLPNYDMVEL